MKKILLLALFTLLVSLPSQAITVVEKDMGYISVNASATQEIAPDAASLSFSIESRSKDSKIAVEQNKEAASALILAVKPLLALDKSDSIKTSSFVLRPHYSYDKNGKKTFQNFSATKKVVVKTRNLDNVSKLIDIAAENHVINISELKFFIEDEQKYTGEIIKEALCKAQKSANLSAATLNQKVKGVRSVRVNTYQQNAYNQTYNGLASAKNPADDNAAVEYGKIKLQANVDAEFYVK